MRSLGQSPIELVWKEKLNIRWISNLVDDLAISRVSDQKFYSFNNKKIICKWKEKNCKENLCGI